MKIRGFLLCLCMAMMPLWTCADVLDYVCPMMGTGGDGRVVPVAAVPFGMVQLGPDTFFGGSGYMYVHNAIQGFSHTHKSGGGGADFLDISFLPLCGAGWQNVGEYPADLTAAFSHEEEHAHPGYYRLTLKDSRIDVELTATQRCGIHRYTFPQGAQNQVLAIDLKKGHQTGCTIYPEDDYDTVRTSRLEQVDAYTVRGYRVSDGWVSDQRVYFYARFSQPIQSLQLYHNRQLLKGETQSEGTDERALLHFEGKSREVCAYVGISPVSMDGARKNLQKEVGKKNFDQLHELAAQSWRQALEHFTIDDDRLERKQVFYTCLYNVLLYPQLYSDVDGRYRSSDSRVYKGNFHYFAGVLGLWDTFRAQNPLIAILYPDVTRDLMRTFQAHYDHCGQLPIWTLAGRENMCMIGYHSMPVIADAYAKGIRGFNAERLFRAMKASAERDTFGFFVHDYRGSLNYKRYHYVPCDKEITSVSKTLEYCYDDWCIAQMARMLGLHEDEKYYQERSGWYKNLYDSSTRFMRGKMSDGSWRTPFDPMMSNHYHEGDDCCEGTAWQWTFFVPHDGRGLINLFGGKEGFVSKMDSLFTASSEVHSDFMAETGDISGMIGQYAHGNEPGHHTIYMYNYASQPWKGQKLLTDVCYNLYNTSPEGICGNDDTGQMSSWFVFTSMGFYPVRHGDGTYFIGSPQFQKIQLRHAHGTLTVVAHDVSRQNCYIQSVRLNGQPYTRSWIQHKDLFSHDTLLEFQMGSQPNKQWGSADEDIP